MAAPVVAFFSLTVVPVTTPVARASLKVAVTLAVRLTAVALSAGVRADTVGAAPVRNVQLVVARGAPAVSRIAAAPPVRVTVYLVSAAKLAVGFRIHWLVVPFWVTA